MAITDTPEKTAAKRSIWEWLSYRRLAILFVILFLLSLLPVFYLAYYDYPTGDSLGYGAPVRQALLRGAGLLEVLRIIQAEVTAEYTTFNGTWFPLYFWRVDPSVWGGRWYGITPYISVASMALGLWVLAREVLRHWLRMERWAAVLCYALTAILMIQYIPTAMGGVYFYPGVMKYIFAYGLAMVGLALTLRGYRTKKAGPEVLAALLMFCVGGSGYPEVMAAGMALFYLTLARLLDKADRRSTLYPLIPLLALCGGFLISALAPGTFARGGEGFGFTPAKIAATLLMCLKAGAEGGLRYTVHVRLTVVFAVLMAFIGYESADPASPRLRLRWVLPHLIVGFLTFCGTYAPELFVGENVKAGISGGVYCSYYLTWLLALAGGMLYAGAALRAHVEKKRSETQGAGSAGQPGEAQAPAKTQQGAGLATSKLPMIRTVLLLMAAVFTLVFRGPIVRNSLDYACYSFIASGRLADYEAQFQERFAILAVEEIQDVVLPEMNDDQYPFMHMALVADPGNFTNFACRKFYGKRSVTAMPREAFYEKYGTELEEIIARQLAEQEAPTDAE